MFTGRRTGCVQLQQLALVAALGLLLLAPFDVCAAPTGTIQPPVSIDATTAFNPIDLRSEIGTTVRILASTAGGLQFSASSFSGPVSVIPLANVTATSAAVAMYADDTEIGHTFADQLASGQLRAFVSYVNPSTVTVTFLCPDCYAYEQEGLWLMFFAPAFSNGVGNSRVPVSVPLPIKKEESRLNFPRMLVVGVTALVVLIMSCVSNASHVAIIHLTRLSMLSRSVECSQVLDFLLNPTQQKFGRGRQAPFLAAQMLSFSIFFGVVLLHSTLLRHFPKLFSKYFPGISFLIFLLLMPGIALTSFETWLLTDAPMRWALAFLMTSAIGGLLLLAFFITGPFQKHLKFHVKMNRFVHEFDPIFIQRWQVFLVPFKGGYARTFLFIEIVSTLAVAGFSAADPVTPDNDGCYVRVLASLSVLGCETVALLLIRPYLQNVELGASVLFRVLEIAVAGLVLGASTSKHPANDLVSAGNGVIMLGCACAFLKSVKDLSSYQGRAKARTAMIAAIKARATEDGKGGRTRTFTLSPGGGGAQEMQARGPGVVKEGQSASRMAPPPAAVQDQQAPSAVVGNKNSPSPFSDARRRLIRMMNYRYISTLEFQEGAEGQVTKENYLEMLHKKFGAESRTRPEDEPGADLQRSILLSMRRRGAHEDNSGIIIQRTQDKHGAVNTSNAEKLALQEMIGNWGQEPPPSPKATNLPSPPRQQMGTMATGGSEKMSDARKRIIRIMNYKYIDTLKIGEAGGSGISESTYMDALDKKFGPEIRSTPLDEEPSDLKRKILLSMRRRGAHEVNSGKIIEKMVAQGVPPDQADYETLLDMKAQWNGEPPPSPAIVPLVNAVPAGSNEPKEDPNSDEAKYKRITRNMNYRYVNQLMTKYDSTGTTPFSEKLSDVMKEINERFGTPPIEEVEINHLDDAKKNKVGGVQHLHRESTQHEIKQALIAELRMRKAHVDVPTKMVAAREDKSVDALMEKMKTQWGEEEPPSRHSNTSPLPQQSSLETAPRELEEAGSTVKSQAPTAASPSPRGALQVPEQEITTAVSMGAFSSDDSDSEPGLNVDASVMSLRRENSVFIPDNEKFVTPLRVPTRRKLKSSSPTLQVPTETSVDGESVGRKDGGGTMAGAATSVDVKDYDLPQFDSFEILDEKEYPEEYHLI